MAGFAASLEATGCKPSAPPPLPVASCDTTETRVGCSCPKSLVAVGGACADHAAELATCGPHPSTVDTCAVACERGEALDPTKGSCIPAKEVAEIPEASWLGLHEGERLTCPTGALELGHGKLGCRPASFCRYHQVWNGKTCVISEPCPVGQYREGGACKPFAGPSGVDLPLWAEKVVRPAVCALVPVSSTPETYHLTLDAPGNELAHLSSAVESSAPEVNAVRRAVEAYAEAVRSIQGPVSSTKAELTIVCPGQTLSAPKIEPKDPDAGL